MLVTKRNGGKEPLDITKIQRAVEWACNGLDVSQSDLETSARLPLYNGVKTEDIQRTLIMTAADKISEQEPQWAYVAARLLLQTIYKHANDGSIEYPHWTQYAEVGVKNNLLDAKLLDPTQFDLDAINDAIKPERDLQFDYLGLQTLADRYLLRIQEDDRIVELPQHMLMRVAMGVASREQTIENRTKYAIEYYNLYSQQRSINSTPTLFNSGTLYPQLSSCFGTFIGDSIDGIMDGMKEIAQYSKFSGGCSIDIGGVRATGSRIGSTRGKAGGPIPYLKLYNDTLIGFDQSGKRKGSGSAYLELWHADVYRFLDLREPGDERLRAHDIFPAMWIPDLFMRRLDEGGTWSLFDPKVVPELHETYGDTFEAHYIAAERAGLATETIHAEDLWFTIMERLWTHGVYWPCFKDTINYRYAQPQIVHQSNLCFSGDTQVAVADGRNAVSIAQLTQEGTTFNVYSAVKAKISTRGRRAGRRVVGSKWKTVIRKARAVYTGKRKLIELTLDNGDTLKCTPDHKLALTTYGKWVEAQDALGLRLEPFFTTQIEKRYRVVNGSVSKVNQIDPLDYTEDTVQNYSVSKDLPDVWCTVDGDLVWQGRKVVSITDAGFEKCYDVQILDECDDNEHNFYIVTGKQDPQALTSSGVLVHNCTEITLRNDENVSFVCNLGSINVAHPDHKLVRNNLGEWQWNSMLEKTTRLMVRNLDSVISIGTIPHAKGRRMQELDRPIGLGVMGWTAALYSMGIDYESPEHIEYANEVMKQISLTAIDESANLSAEWGSYPTFNESTWKDGLLPVDTLRHRRVVEKFNLDIINTTAPFGNLDALRDKVQKGMRNSTLLAIAPTATIANIVGTTQCTELPWDKVFTKKNLSGTFKYLAHTLVNNPHGLPFKAANSVDQLWTVWSAAARQIWIDQAQSTNYFVNPAIPDYQIGDSISNMYKEAWRCGTKTSYYLYGQAEEGEVKMDASVATTVEEPQGRFCSIDAGPDCEACS